MRNRKDALHHVETIGSPDFKVWNESRSINFIMSKQEVVGYIMTSCNFNITPMY